MVRYIAIGNLTIDEILMPHGQYKESQCGGNCLYAAVGAHIWSDDVGIVSLVGTDYPTDWLKVVHDAGIDTGGITVLEDVISMHAGLAYTSNDERFVLEDEAIGRGEYNKTVGEWEEWLMYSPSMKHFPPEFETSVGIHFAPMPVQALNPLMRELWKAGRRLTLDSPWWDAAGDDYRPHLPLLKHMDALLPSLAEVQVYFRQVVDPVKAVRSLGRLGAAATVIKLGIEGCLVYTPQDDQVTHVPAFPANTVDPTGAGDAFCGGFLVGLTETADPVEAARYATVSASFVVEGFSSLYALQVPRAEAELRLPTIQTKII